MNLGFDAISQLPISQVGADNTVTIIATGNNLVASIGNPNISADAVTEVATGNPLNTWYWNSNNSWYSKS